MLLGSGVYGSVTLAEFNNKKFAVKTVNEETSDGYIGTAESFVREVDIMSECDHVNIMNLVSVSANVLIMKYSIMMPLSMMNLRKLIEDKKNRVVYDKEKLSLGIARGLYYLEQKNILHGDLKPDNIVVSENGTPKIIDFGVSIIDPVRGRFQDTMTTYGWKSPEETMATYDPSVYRGFKMIPWTFGIVIYFIYVRDMTKNEDLITDNDFFRMVGTPNRSSSNAFNRYIELTMDDNQKRMNMGEKQVNIIDQDIKCTLVTGNAKIDSLIESCLVWDPEKRISMYEILRTLSDNPEPELSIYEKFHNNRPKSYSATKLAPFLVQLQSIFYDKNKNKNDKKNIVTCGHLACAIYLRSGMNSPTIHYTCLSLAAKLFGIDDLYYDIYNDLEYKNLDLIVEDYEVLKACNFNIHITTSMTYLSHIIGNLEEKERTRLKEKLFIRLLDGEDVLFNIPEDVLD